MIVYFQVEKERLARARIAEMSKGVGRPKVGGPFLLKDLEGKDVTEEELKGKFSLVCFPSTSFHLISWELLVADWQVANVEMK